MEQILPALFILGLGYLVYKRLIKPRLDKRKASRSGGKGDPASSHEN